MCLRYTSARAALLVIGLLVLPAGAQTTIRPAPEGKPLAFVDTDGSIRSAPGGKLLLFIDGSVIRDEPAGKPLLVVDGQSVLRERGGIPLFLFDGRNIRRPPRGRILLWIKHPDICPGPNQKRSHFIDGDQLSREQLVGVLYVLKPELFQLPAEEMAAIGKAMEDAAEKAAKLAREDDLPGGYGIASFSSSAGGTRQGTVAVQGKKEKGEVYAIAFDHEGGPAWSGVGVRGTLPEDSAPELWLAFGPPGTVGLAVYAIEGGDLNGKWFPAYAADGNPANVGIEMLTGPENLDGDFEITSASAPKTGASYGGKVAIKPGPLVLDGDVKTYTLQWTIGDAVYRGAGIRVGDHLIVASGTTADFSVAHFAIQDGQLTGNWFDAKGAKGLYKLSK